MSTWGDYVHRSLDGGTTWERRDGGLYGGWGGPAFTTAIAVDPTNANRVYTSTWRGQLFRSEDAATTWVAIGGGGTWANGQIYVSRSSPNVLYTTHDEYWFGRGTILKSTDMGVNWFNAGRPAGASDAVQLAIDPTDPNLVYVTYSAGIARTTAGGGSWGFVFAPPTGLPYMQAVAVHPAAASQVYGGSYYSGFYRSLDGGGSWTQHNSGIAAAEVTGIEISPSQPSTIYAGAQAVGLLKSTDAGENWSVIGTAQGLQNHSIGGMGVHPTNPNVLVATTHGIWRTTDGGVSFTQETSQYGSGWMRFNPQNPNAVHASVSDWQGGFLFSVDAGDNWYVPYSTYIYPGNYDFHPTLPNVVFSVGNQYTRARRSTPSMCSGPTRRARARGTRIASGRAASATSPWTSATPRRCMSPAASRARARRGSTSSA